MSDALGELYERYGNRVYLYLYTRAGVPQLAEDLTAVVFIKALLALRAGKMYQRSALGWLYGIARNTLSDYFRRPRTDEDCAPLEDELASPLDLDDYAAATARAEALRAAMSHLTAGQGQVIALCYAEGMSNQGVAEMMHTTEGAVKALRRRGLAVLREHMEVTA